MFTDSRELSLVIDCLDESQCLLCTRNRTCLWTSNKGEIFIVENPQFAHPQDDLGEVRAKNLFKPELFSYYEITSLIETNTDAWSGSSRSAGTLFTRTSAYGQTHQ